MSTANVPPKPLVNLYGDSELPPYFEEIVEPKSFRNRLINVLIWTTLLPLILLLFFLQKNFETATEVQNNLQLGVAREAALYVESGISNIRSQLSLALSTYSPETPLSRRSRTFENLLTQNSSIRSLSYTDETGLTTSLRNSQPLETPQHSLATRVFTLNIDQPGTNGILHRTLTASVDISMLAKDFANLLYGQSYSGAIFNTDRQLIYAISSNSHYHNAAYDPLTPIELTQLHESKGEPFLLRTEGDRFSSHIKAFVPIGPMGWTLVISQAQQTRDEAMRETAVIWALGFFAALAGTFFLGSFMAVPITRSFDSLVASVENYGKTGHFTRIDKMLAIEGTTELVKLEETFARMAQSVDKGKEELQKANLRLEDEVQARTIDLVARNEELKTLQTLLAPLSSTGHFMPKTSVIFYCIERFRVLLELSSLVFETEISTPAPHNSIVVRLGSTVYGRLLLPQEAILTADKRDSLERLAYALAIVSANAKLVEHLSQEQAALQTVFESMTDGVVIIGKSGLIRYANEYAGKLLNEGDSVLMLMFSDIMTSNWESITGNRITDDLQNKPKTRVRSRIGGNRVLELLPFTVSDMPGLAGERTGWILRDITQEVSLEAVKENIVGVVAHELKTPLTLLQLQVRVEPNWNNNIQITTTMSTRSLPLILVIDDESKIRRLLTKELEANGFDVVCAGDGEQALEVFAQSDPTPDLVLMDVMMPGMDGFECAERLSKSANVPIIFLSARNEPSFKLRGFDSGADDYITKPFLTEELIARIRAVMRRAHTSEEHNAQREYRNGPMRLSESSRSLWINDREVKLADSEYHLMLALMKHPGSVISHEHLLQRVWGGHSIGDVQNLRVAFSRIRRKLEENGLQGGVISAYSGVGYLLRDLVRDPLL